MRISDWSSDVCSSDLHNHKTDVLVNQIKGIGYPPKPDQRPDAQECKPAAQQGVETRRQNTADQKPVDPFREQQCGKHESKQWRLRSEEHTSELQSLMRISYAVFCLKKKKTCKHDEKN